MTEQNHPTNLTAILCIILVSYLMTILDISIVITALPKIMEDLNFSATSLSWVQNSYTLAFGGLLLLGSHIGDIFGRKKMFITGLMIFTVASLVVGIAPSEMLLLVGRVLQGIGAAVLAPSTLALLSTNFPVGHERTRAVAYYGAVAGVGASIGLVLGGVFAHLLSWRVGFFINLPIGIALMLAAKNYITETERHSGEFDILGALSSTLGMTILVYGIVRTATHGWTDPLTMTTLASGVALLIFFVINEWKAKQPIMPLRLFMNWERAGGYMGRVLFIGAMVGFWFFITQFLQAVKGYSPFTAGLSFLPMTLVNFGVALIVPKLTRQFGNSRLLATGLIITMVGMAWLSRLDGETSYLMGIALPMVLIGIGQGCSLSPLTVAGISGVEPRDAGAASGLVNVSHQLGGSLGLGILVSIFATADSSVLTGVDLLAHRISTSLTVGTGMLALAFIIVCVVIIPNRPHSKD